MSKAAARCHANHRDGLPQISSIAAFETNIESAEGRLPQSRRGLPRPPKIHPTDASGHLPNHVECVNIITYFDPFSTMTPDLARLEPPAVSTNRNNRRGKNLRGVALLQASQVRPARPSRKLSRISAARRSPSIEITRPKMDSAGCAPGDAPIPSGDKRRTECPSGRNLPLLGQSSRLPAFSRFDSWVPNGPCSQQGVAARAFAVTALDPAFRFSCNSAPRTESSRAVRTGSAPTSTAPRRTRFRS